MLHLIRSMVKKKVKKRVKNTAIVKKTDSNVNKALVENFVNLQKALTNLAVKFDNLSDQISKLLQLFEISAKSFAEKYKSGTGEEVSKDTELLDRLDTLLDQNKTIAKGLTLMEEKLREKHYSRF